jgi:3-oxoadipate CoA-transferase alpha subunit
MASAAACTIAQVSSIVPLGSLDPEAIVTPGIFVRRVVAVGGRTGQSVSHAVARQGTSQNATLLS